MYLTEFFWASLIVNLNTVYDDYVTFEKCVFSVTIVAFEAELSQTTLLGNFDENSSLIKFCVSGERV